MKLRSGFKTKIIERVSCTIRKQRPQIPPKCVYIAPELDSITQNFGPVLEQHVITEETPCKCLLHWAWRKEDTSWITPVMCARVLERQRLTELEKDIRHNAFVSDLFNRGLLSRQRANKLFKFVKTN